MRLTWTVALFTAGLALPCTGTAQVRLDPDWMVHVAPVTYGPTTAADSPDGVEAELMRLVVAEQEHYRRTGRFTAYLSELSWNGRSSTIRLRVTAGPDWLLATAVPETGTPMQAVVWRKGARVESGTTVPLGAAPAAGRHDAGRER